MFNPLTVAVRVLMVLCVRVGWRVPTAAALSAIAVTAALTAADLPGVAAAVAAPAPTPAFRPMSLTAPTGLVPAEPQAATFEATQERSLASVRLSREGDRLLYRIRATPDGDELMVDAVTGKLLVVLPGKVPPS